MRTYDIYVYCIQMQSTVVKHKKDGGQSGGVFDSHIIVRVSSFIRSLQPYSFDLLNLTLLRQNSHRMFTPSIFIALFIKRTCELDANVNTDLERVGCGIIRAPPYGQIFGCKLRGCKTKEFSLYHSTSCSFRLTVSALDRDRLQHGIIMCSMLYLAFDPDTNNCCRSGLDVTRKLLVHFLLFSTSVFSRLF